MTSTRPVNSEFTSLAVGCVLVRISFCTTHASDGFVLVLGDQNTFWPCLLCQMISNNPLTSDILYHFSVAQSVEQ